LYGGDLFSVKARFKMKLMRRPYVKDEYHGFTVYRAWDPVACILDVVQDFAPDVVIVQHQGTVPMALRLQSAGIPTAVYMRNVEFNQLCGDLSDLSPETEFIANSSFTAERYHSHFGVKAHVIPPLVERSQYATGSTRENVTFINPVPAKGLETSLEVARLCFRIPFVFLESWPLNGNSRRDLERRIAELPNVVLQGRTENMKSVYAKARVVLAPSQGDEAWGRIATEAHMSGIPVIGSAQGGLLEAVGPGGILLNKDAPPSEWAAAVEKLWWDNEYYNEAAEAALQYSNRPEMDPDCQINNLLTVLERAVHRER
jgi:glycosyltransferase involved in cell wall biosynthesis